MQQRQGGPLRPFRPPTDTLITIIVRSHEMLCALGFGPLPFTLTLLPLRALPCCLTTGVVLALDRRSCALGRTWCLYELSLALRLQGQTRFQVAVPSGLGVGGTEALLEFFSAVDVCKSDTSPPDEKVEVLSKVRAIIRIRNRAAVAPH